jgi:uncharacterized membrane protein YqgA involved in biofilm formation
MVDATTIMKARHSMQWIGPVQNKLTSQQSTLNRTNMDTISAHEGSALGGISPSVISAAAVSQLSNAGSLRTYKSIDLRYQGGLGKTVKLKPHDALS